MKKIPFSFFLVFFFLFFLSFSEIFPAVFSLRTGEGSVSKQELEYYLRLRNEEFIQTMIPKEKFLLGLVQNVNEEIRDRLSEGLQLSDLGIEKVIPPREAVVDEYIQELQRVVALLDEISVLEREARRRVDFQVLASLTELRRQVRKIIDESKVQETLGRTSENLGGVDEEGASPSIQGKETESADSLDEQMGFVDLFEQYKYNRILAHKLKLTEYEFFRTRLLKTATPSQERRMFQRELRKALESYTSGDFSLARQQLRDILATYSHYRVLDDVSFYCAESSYGLNYLDDALEGYRRVTTEYPESSFCAKALVKTIYIYYIYGRVGQLFETYQKLLDHQDQLDRESFGTVSYVVGYAHFKAGEYQKAIESLNNVALETSYYFPSLYLSAACHSNIDQDDVALSIYHRLAEGKVGGSNPVFAQIRNNALLKLGLIYYDRGENDRALSFFNSVSRDFSHYDLSVIGKAWSAYRSGKPGETLQSVEWLFRNSLISNYAYEARVLAASSKELLGHTEEAIRDLKQVYQAGRWADRVEGSSRDGSATLQNLKGVEELERLSLERRDQEVFAEVDQIRRFLDSAAGRQRGREGDYSEAADRLTQGIETLDALEDQAREGEEGAFREEIRSLRSDLIQTLQDHTQRFSWGLYEPEEDPFIRRMGMVEYLKYLFRTLLSETLREKEETKRGIQEAEAFIREAEAYDKFDLMIRMEIKKEELEDYYGRLNQYEVWLRENFPDDLRAELSRWASFSGYGISNINFSRIRENERRAARISRTIDTIDRIFEAKKANLEQRIENLLEDVTNIEEQMRREAERRKQQTREQFFKDAYFEKQRQEAAAGKLHEEPESGKR